MDGVLQQLARKPKYLREKPQRWGWGFSFPSVTRDLERKRIDHRPGELPKTKCTMATLRLCMPRRYDDMGNSKLFRRAVARA